MLIILSDSKGIKSNSEILEFSILLHDAVINKKTKQYYSYKEVSLIELKGLLIRLNLK